jgi:hypothetical protein
MNLGEALELRVVRMYGPPQVIAATRTRLAPI